MNETDKKEYVPISPFDNSIAEDLSMYDRMTYHRDNILCNEEHIRLESGNLYKYSTYTIQRPCKIGGE